MYSYSYENIIEYVCMYSMYAYYERVLTVEYTCTHVYSMHTSQSTRVLLREYAGCMYHILRNSY